MLYLAFLWHMHQPWYLDPFTGKIALPWVRLHGTKDYLDMALLIQDHPAIRATLNVTAPLIEQLQLYAQGSKDQHQELCERPARELSPQEIDPLLHLGFLGASEQMIHPYPRYYELLAKRDRQQNFSEQEIRDLQVWSNLSWMDPRWRRQEPFLRELLRKGRSFTEQEKYELLKIQGEILKKILPAYRALQGEGQVEISTSPWAHPILPLLYDSEVAGQTNPQGKLPCPPFRFPEDVRFQLTAAYNQMTQTFGRPPFGLWPSEGALSEPILPFISQAGFRWVATDEELLWRSLKEGVSGPVSHRRLYQPYRFLFKDQAGEPILLFRDHLLSDLIGFVYNRWPVSQAVGDFMNRLESIEKECVSNPLPPLVLVALDGENPWEFYPQDGEPFLGALYEAIQAKPEIRCTTISGYLKEHPPKEVLKSLAPGSWIRGEFSTWIGHEPQNRAWEELLHARRIISPERSKAMAIAEASDWFWWLGPEHTSPLDPVFDQLFRSQLLWAYQEAGRTSPDTLKEPLKRGLMPVLVEPSGWIAPTLDGKVTSYFEWLHAGQADLTVTSLKMARFRPVFSRLWWGCDGSFLYLRLDPLSDLSEATFQVKINEPRFQVTLVVEKGKAQKCQVETKAEDLASTQEVLFGLGKIIELAFPFTRIGRGPGEKITLTISVEQEGGVVERYPEQGSFLLGLPQPNFIEQFWSA